MSLSKRLQRLGFIVMTLGGAAALAGCTLTPVYSSGRLADSPQLNLAYAKPGTRLAQIIYQDLALHFGSSDSPTAPLATVSVSVRTSGTALSRTVNPNKPAQATVTATLTIVGRDGSTTPPIRVTRFASAGYTTNSQVLADIEARREAEERAAAAAAESLRLAVLASLSR